MCIRDSALFREVFIRDIREDIPVLDILVNRGPAKGDTEMSVLLRPQEGTYRRRGVFVVLYLPLDELGDGKVFPYLERGSLCGRVELVESLGLVCAVPALRGVVAI